MASIWHEIKIISIQLRRKGADTANVLAKLTKIEEDFSKITEGFVAFLRRDIDSERKRVAVGQLEHKKQRVETQIRLIKNLINEFEGRKLVVGKDDLKAKRSAIVVCRVLLNEIEGIVDFVIKNKEVLGGSKTVNRYLCEPVCVPTTFLRRCKLAA